MTSNEGAAERKEGSSLLKDGMRRIKERYSAFKSKDTNITVTKCAYSSCMLPNHNYQYLFQIFYLTVCAFVLMRDDTQLTFFAMSMYVVPILNDLISTKLKWKFLNCVRKLLIVITGILFVGCFLGLANVIIITEEGFEVLNISIFQGTIPRNWVCISLFAEILVPIVLWAGSPTNKTQAIAEKIVRGELKVEEDDN